MIFMKKASSTDLQTILNLIKNMNIQDFIYLRYNEYADILIERLITRINEGHLLLFVEDETVFGFVEYNLIKDNTILWVTSLYIQPEYKSFEYVKLIISMYRGMIEAYDLPLQFAVHYDNKPMLAITRWIKGKQIRVADKRGYITFQVSKEDFR